MLEPYVCLMVGSKVARRELYTSTSVCIPKTDFKGRLLHVSGISGNDCSGSLIKFEVNKTGHLENYMLSQDKVFFWAVLHKSGWCFPLPWLGQKEWAGGVVSCPHNPLLGVLWFIYETKRWSLLNGCRVGGQWNLPLHISDGLSSYERSSD